MKVLLTDVGCKHTLGMVRSLSRAGHHVDCIGTKHCLSSFSRYLDAVAYPQDKFDERHLDDFINFLTASQYD